MFFFNKMSLKLLLFIVTVYITCVGGDVISEDEGSGYGLDETQTINEQSINLKNVNPSLNADNETDSTQTTTVAIQETTNNSVIDKVANETALEKPPKTKPTIVTLSQENEANSAKKINETVPQKKITPTPAITTTKSISVTATTTSSSTSVTTTTTVYTTTTGTDISSKSPANTTEEAADDNLSASFFNSFNLNYLYFLLLLIPIAGIGIWVTFFSTGKKRKGYTEANPRINKTRRMSTPSWVFSEPDFADEEVITLEEEKK